MPSRVWTTFSPPWVGVPDLLIAATARLGDLTVLHYDHDFDLIHEVTGQPMAWVVDAGSVD